MSEPRSNESGIFLFFPMTYRIHNQRTEMKRLRQTEHLTLREIGDRVGASRAAVRMHLKAMGIDTCRQKRTTHN